MSKQSKSHQPYWRPNFNDPSRLPDIKVVRTNFMINSVVALGALMALFIIGQHEYSALTLRISAEGLKSQVQAAAAENKRNLQLSQKFIEASQDVLELERFYSSPIIPHEVLIELSVLRPEGLLFKDVRITEVEKVKFEGAGKKQVKRIYLEYEIDISGEVEDPVLLSDFKQSLQESEIIQYDGMGKMIEESLQARDSKTGIFPFRIRTLIQPVEPSQKGAKG
ncbi:MAG: hypothetical protein ACSHX8_00490 [Opitutaceae bacterium]